MIIQYPEIISNFSAFIDGISYAGRCTKAKVPQFKIQTKSHRGAGMDGGRPVDMGSEDMSTELTFADWPPAVVKLIGTEQRVTLRPAHKARDHTAIGWIVTIGCLWNDLSPEGLGAGEETPLKIGGEVFYFRLEREGEELLEIDIERGIRRVGNVDQLAELRRKMGY